MAFDMGSLFAPNQPPIAPQQQNLWSLQQQFGLNLNGMINAQLVASQLQATSVTPTVPSATQPGGQVITPLIGGSVVGSVGAVGTGSNGGGDVPKADTIQGIGILTWLSAKAGLITCKDKMVISFQLKDFCDQMLNDLTSVLRVGFTLSFHAALNETSEYTATIVQPIYGPEADIVFHNAPEVDLESANPTPPNSKDAYSPQLEAQAIPALLAIFQRHGLQQIQLSSLHSQMSNCGDEDLFRYVGTSSLKRRQFVERRTHIFRLQNDDSIILQFPAVYMAVYKLASFLLRHGGATSIQSLFDFYMGNDFSQDVRDHNGDGRQDFLNLLTAHNWVFALFPNRTYVSVRRNLPRYDYPAFISQHFPEIERSRRNQMSQMGYGQPRGIQRTMSAQMCGPFGGNTANGCVTNNVGGGRQQKNLLLQQQQQQQQQQRSISLWDSGSSLSNNVGVGSNNGVSGGNADTNWIPSLFSPTTWSNTPVASTLSRQNAAAAGQASICGNVNETLLAGAPMLSLISMARQQQQQPKTSRGILPSDLSGNFIPIGQNGCTCCCTCGRGGNVGGGSAPTAGGNAGVIGNRGSSSRASGGSASPPSIDSNSPYERFSPLNGIGSIGDRLSSNMIGQSTTNGSTNTGSDISIFGQSSGPTTSSSTQSNQRYYDPFGTADLLNGTQLSSLRIGN